MTRRRYLLAHSVLAVGLAGTMFGPMAWWQVGGWFRGEPFYHGWPASYWAQDILCCENGCYGTCELFFVRRGDHWAVRWADKVGIHLDPLEWRPAPPPFWTGNTGWEPDAHVDEAAIPALLELTNHSDPFVRGYAAHTLGDLGQKAWVAVPRLTEMLKDDGMAASNYLLVRRLAVLALLRIDYKVYRVEHDKLGERWFWPPHFWPQFNNAVSEETEPPPEADKERP